MLHRQSSRAGRIVALKAASAKHAVRVAVSRAQSITHLLPERDDERDFLDLPDSF